MEEGPFERIRQCATVSVGRACLFGLLGVATFVLGFTHWPLLALKFGGGLSALGAAILALKALQAPHRSYRKSETWLLLEKRHDLTEEVAARVIPEILRQTFWRFATYAASTSLAFWAMVVLLRFFGVTA